MQSITSAVVETGKQVESTAQGLINTQKMMRDITAKVEEGEKRQASFSNMLRSLGEHKPLIVPTWEDPRAAVATPQQHGGGMFALLGNTDTPSTRASTIDRRREAPQHHLAGGDTDETDSDRSRSDRGRGKEQEDEYMFGDPSMRDTTDMVPPQVNLIATFDNMGSGI